MSVKNWWRSKRRDDDDEYESASPEDEPGAEMTPGAEEPDDLSVSWATPSNFAALDRAGCSVTLSTTAAAGAAVDSLIPLATNAGQAAQEYGMAIVKFLDGVGWADLCVRKSDGRNLLSSFDRDPSSTQWQASSRRASRPWAPRTSPCRPAPQSSAWPT